MAALSGVLILGVAALISPAPSTGAAAASQVTTDTTSPVQLFKLGVVTSNPADVTQFEADINRHADIFLWYQALDESFDVNLLRNVAAGGRAIQLSWEPIPHHQAYNPADYRLANFTNGTYDTVLRQWARQIRDFGYPVLFRPMCEMNGNWSSWSANVNGNTAADYINAWRHLHDIFAQEGATNVEWVWSPNRDGSLAAAQNTFDTLYPGDDYVDYIGFSGYNWGTMYNTPTWVSSWQWFQEVFADSYDVMTSRTNKPIMISEVASTELGGDKAAWITDAFGKIPERFPRIVSLTWFNLVKETDWRVESSPASLQAFKDSIQRLDSASQCGTPSLDLQKKASYWANFADYGSRLLTVDFTIRNSGFNGAYAATITGSYNTDGVTEVTPLPLALGDINSGNSLPLKLQYRIPPGVSGYVTSTYASVYDRCGSVYRYPRMDNKI